jgi:hypothetical protein
VSVPTAIVDERLARAARSFDELGRSIDEQWRGHDYDEERLPDIACEQLAAAAIGERVSAIDVIRWVHSPLALPSQADATAAFAQPPVTVYAADRFYISVLYWVDGTTAIHEHGFSGALQVLAGSSIHTAYAFDALERIHDRLLIGELRREGVTQLAVGDIRPILPGGAGIHSLFHLERPSATIVVRTYRDPGARPAYTYHPPHVAHEDRYLPARARKRLQTLELLRSVDPELFQSEAEGLAADADLEFAFLLLDRVHAAASIGREDLDAFLSVARAAGWRFVDELLEVLTRRRRVERVNLLRRQIVDADQRYLLALAMLAPGRANIVRLAGERFGAHGLAERLAAFAEMVRDRAGGQDDELAPVLRPFVA